MYYRFSLKKEMEKLLKSELMSSVNEGRGKLLAGKTITTIYYSTILELSPSSILQGNRGIGLKCV